MNELLLLRRVSASKSLPYDAEIEYLQQNNNNSAYIDTGIILNSNDVLSGRVYKGENADSSSLFGAVGSSYTTNSIFAYSTQYGSPYLRFNLGSSQRQASCPKAGEFIFYASKNEIRVENIDGTVYNRVTSKVTTYYEVSRSCMLFKANGDGAAMPKLRIMWFKVENKIDLIPVRVGTVGYMYDKVSKQLFGNAGTGSFILGPDKTN